MNAWLGGKAARPRHSGHADPRAVKLDDPRSSSSGSTRARSASRSATQTYRELTEGVDPRRRSSFEAVAKSSRATCSRSAADMGELAERVREELGAEVVARRRLAADGRADAARGVDAHVGDVQELPFADGAFDCVVANWMLYHVPDLDRGLERAGARAPSGRPPRRRHASAHDHMQELLGPARRRRDRGRVVRPRERRAELLAPALRAGRAARRRRHGRRSPTAPRCVEFVASLDERRARISPSAFPS